MRKSIAIPVIATARAFITGELLFAQAPKPSITTDPQESRLPVVWTSGDPDVAHRVSFMYCHNAKKQNWFDQVTLVVWGPSARLLAGDKDLQAKIKANLGRLDA
jgi:hypothetical protein